MGQEQSNVGKVSGNPTTSPVGNIVVVKENKKRTKEQQISKEPDLLRLEAIENFFPLMRSSLNIPNMVDFDSVNKLDAFPARKLCSRYEKHLKLCAEAVAFDQDVITHRVKELDGVCSRIHRDVSERYKKLQDQMCLIRTVEDVKKNTDRVEATLQEIVPLMEKLNNMLPVDERLEPFLKTS